MLHLKTCPDESTLWRFLQDELAGADAERIDDHIGGCPACQRALDHLVGSLPGRWLPDSDGEEEDAPGTHAVTASLGVMPRISMSSTEPEDLSGPVDFPSSHERLAADDRPPRLLLFGEIARGGMGVILKGRDVALGRDLAVKILLERHRNKPSLIRRFVLEAQLAGRLEHPGTVPIHELGALADGRPYFAMKLVKGRTLDALLKVRDAPSENLPRFLGIFEQVCQAVAYAHARGVIHRDLKPANVMVGRFGEVQVMDWGLAKVLTGADVTGAEEESEDGSLDEPQHEAGDLTDPGSVLGTWAYMSPEQARGQGGTVDRRSDVFGLGAVLCEILTGEPPYFGPDVRSVRLQAIEARMDGASARLMACGADVELIRLAERCLSVMQADRPAEGGEVASAVAAYLSGVQERLQQERLARERQEVQVAEGRRRHRVVGAASLCVLLTLSLAVVASTIFALGQRSARQQATQQSLVAEESLTFLEDVLFRADPKSEPNRDITLREAVDRMTERLNEGKLGNQIKTPESNARVRITLGKLYVDLGEFLKARALFAEADRIASNGLAETHPTAMTALDQLGQVYLNLEQFVDAERVLIKAYELQRMALGPEHEDTIHTYAKLSDLYTATGKLDQALEIGEKVLNLRRKIWGDEYEYTLVSMNNLGLLYRELGQPEKAMPLFEEALRTATRTLTASHPSTLTYKHNYALVCEDLGRWDEALSGFSDCLEKTRKVLGENHFATLEAEYGVANVVADFGKYEEARTRYVSILERLRSSFAENHTFRGRVLVQLGRCLTALGRYPEAERTLQEARALLLRKVGPGHGASRGAAKALEELADRKNRANSHETNPGKREDH